TLCTERQSLLQKKDKEEKSDGKDNLRFISTYSPNSKKFCDILNKHWSVLTMDGTLKAILPSQVQVCYRRSPNLKDLMCHSHYGPKKTMDRINGSYPCGECNMCNQIQRKEKFQDRFGKEWSIWIYINCKSQGVIYCIECPCNLKYVGVTTQMLKHRMQKHCSTIRNADNDIKIERTLSTVAQHFREFHNSDPKKLSFWAIEQVKLGIRKGNLEQELLKRESQWIFKLNTVSPHGINENNLFTAFL
ncbi:hypothetical protein XELAEV_18025477mg, partial [Xenopus laevis]